MRILLIYPDLKIHVNFPVGLGLISAVLREGGHETKILHFNEELGVPFEVDKLDKAVGDFDPQLIAFSSVSNQFQYVLRMISHLTKLRDIPILVGGVHATIAPEKVLQIPGVDMICRGEGELAILELVDIMEMGGDLSSISNMGFNVNGTAKINPLRPLIDSSTLDSLPFPDRAGFDFELIVSRKHGWANVMAGRGCQMNCTYCLNHFFRKTYSDQHSAREMLRYRRVDSVLAEVADMKERYPHIELMNFDDDIFTLDREWLGEFADKYPKQIGIPFACNAHPRTLTTEVARSLAEAGCVEVKIGIESGNDRVRRQILKRPMAEDTIVNAFKAAEKAGIRTWSFNMIGIPTETKEEMHETARLNARIRPYITRCSIFFPYEGTDLHQYSTEHNLIQSERAGELSSHLEDSILNMPQLSREEIVKFKILFKWYVDSYSDIEAAPLFRKLIDLFNRLPDEYWANGQGQRLYKEVDTAVDGLLRTLKMEHYATRRHLDLNFSPKQDYELP
jgi:radical SAM superfamily enzyme YgiQ (UPF0313 family)